MNNRIIEIQKRLNQIFISKAESQALRDELFDMKAERVAEFGLVKPQPAKVEADEPYEMSLGFADRATMKPAFYVDVNGRSNQYGSNPVWRTPYNVSGFGECEAEYSTWLPAEAKALAAGGLSVYAREPKGLPANAPKQSRGERKKLEEAANAFLAEHGDAMVLSDEISKPIGADAIGYGHYELSWENINKLVWGYGSEMLGYPVAVGKPDASVAFDEDDREDHVADAMGLRDIVVDSHMKYADAVDLVSFYDSVEGRAMIAAQKAMRAKRRNVVKHVSRDSGRKLAKLERAEASGRIAPHMMEELKALRAASDRVEVSLVEVFPSEFEHSYNMSGRGSHLQMRA